VLHLAKIEIDCRARVCAEFFFRSLSLAKMDLLPEHHELLRLVAEAAEGAASLFGLSGLLEEVEFLWVRRNDLILYHLILTYLPAFFD